MKKKLLLLLMLLPLVANAYDAYVDGIYYNFSGNEAEVTYTHDNYSGGNVIYSYLHYQGDVVIPSSVYYNSKTYSVTSIGTEAFWFCQHLTSVTIPNSVTSIGNGAFRECWNLTSVTIGNSVTSIGEGAFSQCSKLRSITIPNSVTSIGSGAFSTCSKLTSITIPNSVTSIGDWAFDCCSSLTSIKVETGNTKYDSRNDCNAIIETATNTLIKGCNKTIIPNSVTSISRYAFYGCPLTFINIPNSVTSIGEYAFAGCYPTSITIGSSVTSIDEYAFAVEDEEVDYYDLTNIPTDVWCYAESVPSAESNVFKNLDIGSATLHVPPSALNAYKTTSPWSWFGNIVALKADDPHFYNICIDGIYYNLMGNEAEVTISFWEEYDGEGNYYSMISFYEGNKVIPDSVTYGKTYNVTSIGKDAFRDCGDLTSVSIPKSVTSIGNYAFANCSGLTDVYCYAVNIPATGNGVFTSTPINSATLHVPTSALNTYKTTSPWSGFGNIVATPKITYTLTYIVDGDVYKMYELEEGSDITPEPAPTKDGYTFSGWSEIPETMPDEDVTVTGSFIPNSYALTYIVDGNVYKTDSIAFGTEIIPEPAPTKEGYTFSGWSYIPPTMPAADVVVMGTFTINSYTLTYLVDGEEYKTSTVTYGSEITPEEEPTKEGYTFSGWSEIPETMPAEDVVVTGTFIVNSYALTYIVDGEEYKTYSIAYGVVITPEEEPTKEGYTFSGWSEIPETMPAEDVTVTGSFTINQYLLTYVIDGEEYKSYEVDYNTALTPEPAPTKRGMTFSGWGDMPETMPAHDLTLTGTYSWAQEAVDGVVYQVTDTLSNYASVIGTEDASEVTILNEVDIDGYVYTVNCIEDDALPKTTTINVTIGKLLLWLWENDYTNIKETESGRSLNAPEVALVGLTASSLTLSYVNDYPELSETVVVSGSSIEKGENGYEVALKGLEPNNLYEGLASVTLTFEDASYTKSYSFSTKPLTLVALQPRVVSLGNVIVAANSNLDDEETNVGFEWRRIDWTDDFESRTGAAYLYEGIMEGYIRSLNHNYLWKFRPYYTSSAGNTYYSEWKGMDPSDYSYFEPTVHTYAPIAVTDSTAEVKGYVMQGTDDVESQGFMYWTTSSASSRRKVNGVPVDATVVEVSGHVMRTTLAGLEYDTEYCFVAFVKNENGETFYGEMQSFKTNSDPDSIEDIKASEEVTEVARYDISGRMIAKPQKGINIIRYSDGTARKILIK